MEFHNMFSTLRGESNGTNKVRKFGEWDDWGTVMVMQSMGEGSSEWDEIGRGKGDERKGSEGAVEGEFGGRNWRCSLWGSKAAGKTAPEREGEAGAQQIWGRFSVIRYYTQIF